MYVYVPFLFGVGMPVLYPITLANIVVQYYLDRVMVAYFHSQPPLIGIDMSVVTFRLLEWGSLLYLPMSYWMLSNPQIFSNKVSPLQH